MNPFPLTRALLVHPPTTAQYEADSAPALALQATIEKTNKRFANYPDQYGMNIVLHDQWLRIDDRWNHFVTERDKTPYILHFVERKPIYNTYKNGEDYRLFFLKHLQMTAWRNTPLITEKGRYAKKLKNIWDKLK